MLDNTGRNNIRGYFRALHVPSGGTATLQVDQWNGAGALYVDTTGGNKGLFYYIDGVWIRLYDTLDAVTANAINGLSVSSNTVVLGGSSITQPTAITFVSNPITYIKNGVSYSAKSDSASTLYANFTQPSTTTDSNISTMISRLVYSRKTLGGAANQPVQMNEFLLAQGGGSAGSGKYMVQFKINNGTATTRLSLTSSGAMDDVVTYNGARLGINGSGTNYFLGSTGVLSAVTSGTANTAVGSALTSNTSGR